MIEHFKHKGLQRLFERGDRSRIRPDLADKAARILAALHAAEEVQELDLPGYRLHRLTGNLQGLWSISLSRNHRIVFRFEQGKAFEIDLVDYH